MKRFKPAKEIIMPVEQLFKKNRKLFINPDSDYNDNIISWSVGVDAFGDDDAQFRDIDAEFTVGFGRDSYNFSLYMATKDELAERMKEIERLINNLAEFSEAISEAAIHLKDKESTDDDSIPCNV